MHSLQLLCLLRLPNDLKAMVYKDFVRPLEDTSEATALARHSHIDGPRQNGLSSYRNRPRATHPVASRHNQKEIQDMSATPPTAMTSCLQPIDKAGLEGLIAKGRENPQAIRTLKCRTVAEGRFRHLNMIRTDTAPNPSEASLAALGSCLAVGIHANAVARGITINSLELELEADINITAVWGTGDTSPKPVGFDAVQVKVHLDADAHVPRTL